MPAAQRTPIAVHRSDSAKIFVTLRLKTLHLHGTEPPSAEGLWQAAKQIAVDEEKCGMRWKG